MVSTSDQYLAGEEKSKIWIIKKQKKGPKIQNSGIKKMDLYKKHLCKKNLYKIKCYKICVTKYYISIKKKKKKKRSMYET